MYIAGVCGNLVNLIGDYMDYDKFGKPKTHFWFYEMDVKEVLDKWPEMRKRQWVKKTKNKYKNKKKHEKSYG